DGSTSTIHHLAVRGRWRGRWVAAVPVAVARAVRRRSGGRIATGERRGGTAAGDHRGDPAGGGGRGTDPGPRVHRTAWHPARSDHRSVGHRDRGPNGHGAGDN